MKLPSLPEIQKPYAIWAGFVTAVYMLLIALGITTTSVGISGLRDDPAAPTPGLLANGPDAIRSDEFLRATPLIASERYATTTDEYADLTTPLAFRDPEVRTPTLLFRALRVEQYAFRAVGYNRFESRFAAQWWFFTYGALLLLPLWLRRRSVPLSLGIPATVAIVLMPATIWWSWGAMTQVANATAAALLAETAALLLVTRQRTWWRRWVLGGAAALGAAYWFARLLLSYQPWSFPMAFMIVVPTVVAALALAPRKLRLALVASAIAMSAMAIVYFSTLRPGGALDAVSETVYPGSRRTLGNPVSLEQVFGSPHLWFLQRSPSLSSWNYSEISTFYNYLGVAAATLALMVDWRQVERNLKVGAATLGVVVAMFAAWILFAFPEPFRSVPILNLIDPKRMAQIVGVGCTILFVFVVAAYRQAPGVAFARRTVGLLVGAAVFVVLAHSGSLMHIYVLPGLPLDLMAVTSIVFAVVTALVATTRRAIFPWLFVVLTAATTMFVSPWQQGLADLHDGAAARFTRAHAREDPTQRVASDSIWFDALLLANAVPSLSGQQTTAPNSEEWEKLDPERASVETWNRGASYVNFAWADEGTATSFGLPSPDLIQVSIDPCGPEAQSIGLVRIYSSRPLSHSCLTDESSFGFGGTQFWSYGVS
jgi:hypothetical protein